VDTSHVPAAQAAFRAITTFPSNPASTCLHGLCSRHTYQLPTCGELHTCRASIACKHMGRAHNLSRNHANTHTLSHSQFNAHPAALDKGSYCTKCRVSSPPACPEPPGPSWYDCGFPLSANNSATSKKQCIECRKQLTYTPGILYPMAAPAALHSLTRDAASAAAA
jgi:hypothetical protein